jgi:hypothetical protein
MTGDRQVFANEVLGKAYDSQPNIFCEATWKSMAMRSSTK